jgi:hypothetical protein
MVAAAIFVVLDVVLGPGASTLVIGILALFMSRLPGGIVGALLSLRDGGRLPARLANAYTDARRPGPPDLPAVPLQPSAFARQVLEERSLETAGR